MSTIPLFVAFVLVTCQQLSESDLETITLDSSLSAMAVSPDGKRIFAASERGLSVLSIEDSSVEQEVKIPTRVKQVTLSPIGEHILARGTFGDCLIAKIVEGKVQDFEKIPDHKSRISAFAFSIDGKLCVSADNKKNISVWNAESREVLHRAEIGEFGNQSKVLFVSKKGSQVLSMDASSVCLIDMKLGKPVQRMKFESWGNSPALISPNGEFVVAWRPWKFQLSGTRQEMVKTIEMKSTPESILFHSNSQKLSMAFRDRVEIYDVDSLKVSKKIPMTFRHGANRQSISKDGKVHAFGSTWEKKILIYHAPKEYSSNNSDEED